VEKKMKKLLGLIVAGFFLATVSTVFAADSKVGVVDVQKVLQGYSKVAQMETKLKNQFGPEQQKMQATSKEISDEIAKFNRDSSVMKQADKKAAQDKIVKQQNDFRNQQVDFQKKFFMARDEAMQALLNDVKAAVAKVAAKEHFNLVLAKANVAYNDAGLDITDKVSKELK
jgi:outer membrane protein